MATKPVSKPGVEGGDGPQEHRIRITLTSKNVKNLEKGEAGVPQGRLTHLGSHPRPTCGWPRPSSAWAFCTHATGLHGAWVGPGMGGSAAPRVGPPIYCLCTGRSCALPVPCPQCALT